ncbi:hypothetical protein [Streptomyces sp. NPDC007929]|uniref:hypothetical protein n=1 Tax=unclassified Streptomyces TaxID=2593676 RepID=UPI0036E4016D
MSPSEPHHLHRRTVLRGAAATTAGALLMPVLKPTPAAAAEGGYVIRYDQPKQQTIRGLGFEIQSDSIGSGNNGLPEAISGVPYDLTPAERTRFYQQMLKGGRSDRGFRYCRLALGLYYRGLRDNNTRLKGRYDGQTALLADMISQAGIEGVAAEYWSPAPAWKSNNAYIGGTLKSFATADLEALGDAMVDDLDYLSSFGVPISAWGLQNEPEMGHVAYSCCKYSPAEYAKAFRTIAKKIALAYPDVEIHADSWDGWSGAFGTALRNDPEAMKYVKAWTYHRIGSDSNDSMHQDYHSGALGLPVYSNEFEYQVPTSNWKCINTAQSIMNWMTFQNSPTWYWLHALKPIGNSEASGYSLGYWRPPGYTEPGNFPDLAEGHWTWNPQNWNAVAGFLRYMPWDSARYVVDEETAYENHRIMAWKTPAGKPVFAVTNRTSSDFTYTIDCQTAASFQGYRFGPSTTNQHLGQKTGPDLTITVPKESIEFWVRTP